MKIFNGIAGLLSSRKGVMALISLALLGVVTISGHLDTNFSVCLGVIYSLLIASHTATDIALQGVEGHQ